MRLSKKLKIVIMSFAVMALLVMSTGYEIKADTTDGKPGVPSFTLKKANSGTGVKISINPTEGADGYDLYITNRDNGYSKYLKNSGKYEFNFATIPQDGQQIRSYVVKGLPAGKYTFKVAAYKKNADGGKDLSKYVFSKEQSIKITHKGLKVKYKNVKTGDTVVFGSYEQDWNIVNGKEPIEWIVLNNSGSELLLLSKYALDCLPYNSTRENVSWKDCSLRDWLNNVFYKNAFSSKEKKKIVSTELEDGIKDKVFILSFDDITNPDYGFDVKENQNDEKRRCAATEYARSQGTWTLEKEDTKNLRDGGNVFWTSFSTEDCEATCWWWLRSAGGDAEHIASVNCYGVGNSYGDLIDDTYLGIRPVISISY